MPSPAHFPWRSLGRALPLLATLAGCGAPGGSAPEAARTPARAGEVWEVVATGDRATAGGELLAYIHGLHVVVLDGSTAYAGTTRLGATKGPGGERVFALAEGLEARLVEQGDSLELRFSTGEHVPMRKQSRRTEQ